MVVNKNIIFLGAPGSGKGTISSLLEKSMNLIQISTGDIFREQIKKETPLGLEVKKIVESGQYVPDDITNEIVKNKVLELEKQNQRFILDGYPRTLEQAKFLDSLDLTNFLVINLEIEEEVVVKRLSQRWFCSICKSTFNETNLKSSKHPLCQNDENQLIQRADDKPEAIKKRLDVYKDQTQVLIDYYKNKKNLVSVNSDNKVDIILSTIEKIIKENI